MEERMVKSAGKSGRTRRSGTKSRAGRAVAAETAAVSVNGASVESMEECAAAAGEVCSTACGSADEMEEMICETGVGLDSGTSGDASAAALSEDCGAAGADEAVSASSERVPGELDMLRGELLCEELEQNAVEQMFQWMKEHSAEEDSLGAGLGEVSGTALLEAVHHGRHVAALSLFLFEAFSRRFELDIRWARLLAQAALWHDLGFAAGGRRRHHKRSMEIIEGNDRLSLSFGLEDSDRSLVALLARYHRRAWPGMKHRRFAALSREERRSLCACAALLRVADGLDYRHRGAVEEMRVTLRRRSMRLVCFGAESCRKECRRALKKGDLLERLYGGRLDIEQGKEGERDVL